jgi:hypothetical protein
LNAQPGKLYGMGFRNPIAKSTLADANELRDWRMWHDLATVLIRRGQTLGGIGSIGRAEAAKNHPWLHSGDSGGWSSTGS